MNKKVQSNDWHNADIKAALEKAGWSLSQLSTAAGYRNRGTLKKALSTPWPLGEQIIAHVLNLNPWDIWPSRYIGSTPNRGRKPKNESKWDSIKDSIERNKKTQLMPS